MPLWASGGSVDKDGHPPCLQAVTSPASPGPPPLQSSRELPEASDEIEEFRRRLTTLEVENARLKAGRAVDLTGRKEVETALADSEERYRIVQFHR